MRYLLLVFLMCLFTSVAFATSQLEEQIMYNGERRDMSSRPLESYFNENHPRPREFSMHGWFGSSCWRGYIGYWQIENDFLYLERLLHCYGDDEDEIPLSMIFKEDKPPIKAIWCTGDLKLPEGRRLLADIHEKDIIITVKNGQVVSERIVDNKEKYATRSEIDVLRTGGFEYSTKDDWNWIDARLIRTVELGKQFVTRGGFIGPSRRKPPVLWIPCTPTTPEEEIPIQRLPEDFSDEDFGYVEFVEIGAHLEKNNGDYLLYVDWIRILEGLKTIHHPSFKAAPNVEAVWPCIDRGRKEISGDAQ
jgi:hypothetical protein